MSFRVCIPCAGTGSRLGEATRFINKSLVSISNRPVLSHLIDHFPADAEFVIALGHKGHLVRELLELAYPHRRFFFADVAPFEGPGSGLGLSLLACRLYLQQPFVFISCDTLVDESIPAPSENWMGYAKTDDLRPYRTLQILGDQVLSITEKGLADPATHRAYIGLAGIHNYGIFWDAMIEGGAAAIETGEAFGLRSLLPCAIRAHGFTWHDTGNTNTLSQARMHYRQQDEPNILEKPNEAIWFVGDSVIKFSDDTSFIANRVKRVREIAEYVPAITASSDHMYRYKKVHGCILSEVANLPTFRRLLDHCLGFWIRKPLSQSQSDAFRANCLRFYRDKTLERVEQFYRNFGHADGDQAINGVSMPTLENLLQKVDWEHLADGSPGRFHGDFHFENILFTPDERFVFLDWRQDFAGDLSVGDIYYDLAKLMHGLIVSHELIASNLYRVNWCGDRIDFDVHRKQSLVECEHFFHGWLTEREYDRRKVCIMTALIYLNIAALHHHPYCELLYALGKSMLFEEIGK
ncbi:MAG: phosphotransferase [Betaproteobacteria bacterium]|nr:phosphotransferase [Betaproteobacteria bacterium]